MITRKEVICIIAGLAIIFGAVLLALLFSGCVHWPGVDTHEYDSSGQFQPYHEYSSPITNNNQ